jgi:hypothetical protein
MPAASLTRTIERWPDLPYEGWKQTAATLHMWTQIVGKIRMVQTPWINHSWHVPLYVTSRGLTTSAIPHGERTFQIDFDFTDHQLIITTGDGDLRTLPLEPQATADFYARVMATLDELRLPVPIYARPNEVEKAIPFAEDREHASYDADAAHRFWQALVQVNSVFQAFRARFIGKCSPVHFFWGSFDLAVTRFSGRTAPQHPGGFPNMPDDVTREAYSHEVSSAGFWLGSEQMPYPIFYSYAYPSPDGFSDGTVRPASAAWNTALGEFVLPYDDVRKAAAPQEMLLDFLQTTYEAAADRAGWDRAALKQTFVRPAGSETH